MLKKIMIAATLSLTLMSTSSWAQQCAVPVCDINAKISELSKQKPEERAAYFSELYSNNVANKDFAVARNLRDFGRQAYTQAKNLNDPTVNVLWTVYIRQIGLQGVLAYAPFNKNEATFAFLETSKIPELNKDRQQQIRFTTFGRWKAQIPELTDLTMMFELSEFLNNSRDLSVTLKDEDYIIREANYAIDLLSKRVSYLYPIYEGVFAVKVRCLPLASACEPTDLRTDRIVTMNSLTGLGVFTSLPVFTNTYLESAIGSEQGRPAKDINFLFSKSKVEQNGTTLKAQADDITIGTRPSEIAIQLDPKTQVIKASATTTHTTGALHLEGEVLFSPIKYYLDQVPTNITQPTLHGIFEGTFGDQKMKIIIRQRLDKTLIGTAIVYGAVDTYHKIDFTTGDYVAHRQVINLTGVGSRAFTPYKMTLAYRFDAQNKLYWTGAFFSTTGYLKSVSLIRTGNLQEGNGPDVDAKTIIDLIKN